MSYQPANPLIVQGDHTILAEVASPLYTQARDALARFAELVKSPEHVHTYRLTPLSIWNARAAGVNIADMCAALRRFSKFPVPDPVLQEIESLGLRYGLTVIERPEKPPNSHPVNTIGGVSMPV